MDKAREPEVEGTRTGDVILQNFNYATRLNGKVGKITGWDADEKRYWVWVDGEKEQLKLLPTQLAPPEAEAPTPAKGTGGKASPSRPRSQPAGSAAKGADGKGKGTDYNTDPGRTVAAWNLLEHKMSRPCP